MNLIEYCQALIEHRNNPQVLKQLREIEGEKQTSYSEVVTLYGILGEELGYEIERLEHLVGFQQQLFISLLTELNVDKDNIKQYTSLIDEFTSSLYEEREVNTENLEKKEED